MLMAMQQFKIAFDKAKEITALLSSQGKDASFIPLEDIIDAVKSAANYAEVYVTRQSFAALAISDKGKNDYKQSFGAMLSTSTNENGDKIAHLIVNSDYSADMQRFSVVHELGHLITEVPNFVYETPDDGKFTVSAHVNPDITYISEEKCKKNKYLIAEQIANIFALLVLIPKDIKIRDIVDNGLSVLTKRYGVTEDAIYSRMLLSNVTY